MSPFNVNSAVTYNRGRKYPKDAIRVIQGEVGARIDGIFGPDTTKHY